MKQIFKRLPRRHFGALAAALVICQTAIAADEHNGALLQLQQTIPLPGVEGRIDHLAFDGAGERLFVCALGNNTVEVIDLHQGTHVHTISGLGAPQGVAYVSGRLFVANDSGGMCDIYGGKDFQLLGKVDLKDDADNARYDPATKRVYVGFGSRGIAILNAQLTEKKLDRLSSRPTRKIEAKPGAHIVDLVGGPDAN